MPALAQHIFFLVIFEIQMIIWHGVIWQTREIMQRSVKQWKDYGIHEYMQASRSLCVQNNWPLRAILSRAGLNQSSVTGRFAQPSVTLTVPWGLSASTRHASLLQLHSSTNHRCVYWLTIYWPTHLQPAPQLITQSSALAAISLAHLRLYSKIVVLYSLWSRLTQEAL